MADFGLYKKEYEHDSCGIGFVADIKGCASHGIVGRALEVLERMTHRGAESADNKTGDGAGVLLRIPHAFYKALIPALPAAGEYGTGLLFLPKEPAAQDAALAKVDELAHALGLSVPAVRDVPVDSSVLGAIARAAEPAVKQVFLTVGSEQWVVGSVRSGCKPSTNADNNVCSDISDKIYPPPTTHYPLNSTSSASGLRIPFALMRR